MTLPTHFNSHSALPSQDCQPSRTPLQINLLESLALGRLVSNGHLLKHLPGA